MGQGMRVVKACIATVAISVRVAPTAAGAIVIRRGSHVGRRFGWFVATSCALSVVALGPAVEAGRANPGSGVSSEARAFAQANQVSLDIARERLGWHKRAPRLSKAARSALGPNFGGLWIDNQAGGRLKLALTSAGSDHRSRAIKAIQDSGLDGSVDLVRVQRSEHALEEAGRDLGGRLADVNAGSDGPIALETRLDLNAVRILAPPSDVITDSQQDFIRAARERYGAALVVDRFSGLVEEQSCSYPFCTAPLRGGIKVGPDWTFQSPFNGQCTGAFIARGRGTDSNLYQLTAAHCALSGTWGTKLGSSTASWTAVGDWMGSYYGSLGDSGKYKVADEIFWNPKPWIYRPGTSESYPIYSDADPVQGQTICISGAVTSSNCGQVTTANHTFTATGGVTMTGVRANYCSTNGDSGAPVYASNVALGLHHGAYAACDTLFTKIRNAEDVLNVDVVHATSSPGYALRDSNSSGAPDYSFTLTGQQGGDQPVAGDWDGDGFDTVGFYRSTTATWYLRNSNSTGSADFVFQFGSPEDRPVVGDWNADGKDTIGVYRPNGGVFYLRDTNSAGAAQYQFQYGNTTPSDDLPVAGDWNNSGNDTIGVYRPSNGTFYLRNTNNTGPPDHSFPYGNTGFDDLPLAGDWDENGYFSVGIYRQSTGQWFLDNEVPGNQPISYAYTFGTLGSSIPIVGDWNNSGTDTPGAVHP